MPQVLEASAAQDGSPPAADPPPLAGEPRLLSGWGRTAPTRSLVVAPRSTGELADALERSDARGAVARGLGRSYGDAAQNAGGAVLDIRRLHGIRKLDVAAGTVTVGAGASLDELTRFLLPQGLFPPVLPGTAHVTVGGAIASDIHGKGHHRDGAFADHVASIDLVTPGAGTLRIGDGDGEGAFRATAGGMGLTGVVAEATLRLLPVETSRMLVDTERAADLDDLMQRMESGDLRYRYSVAWIDCLARGRSLGRSVLTRGDHAGATDLDGAADRLALPSAREVAAPPWAPPGLLRPTTVRAFNELWYRRAPRAERGAIQTARQFFHPLDGIDGWNRLYGPRGFLQYQFVVPFGSEDTVREALELLSSTGEPSFLAVIKRMGRAGGPLAFPIPGWTLALDLPAGDAALSVTLDRLDGLVAEAGGRVYLSKDARLRPELLPEMYPRLEEWRSVRERLDPEGRLRSDLGRRLGLCG